MKLIALIKILTIFLIISNISSRIYFKKARSDPLESPDDFRGLGCTDKFCSKLCTGTFYNGHVCTTGYCFKNGRFCFCKYMDMGLEKSCKNIYINKKLRAILEEDEAPKKKIVKRKK